MTTFTAIAIAVSVLVGAGAAALSWRSYRRKGYRAWQCGLVAALSLIVCGFATLMLFTIVHVRGGR